MNRTMNRTILVITGIALAGGLAANSQEQEEQPFNPNRDITAEPESSASPGTEDPGKPSAGVSHMTVEELRGMKVITLTGEEIGEIADVGTSPAHDGRVATVDVGGFIGVGEKTIAIPLSELQPSLTEEGSVRTSMTRSAIESQPEFDDTAYVPDE